MPVNAAYAAVLAAALAHASWNALLKNSGDRVLMLSAIRLVGLVAGIVAAVIAPLPSKECLPYLISAAAIHYMYFALMIRSYRVGDMNQVYPIARGTAPLLVLLFVLLPGAWLAGEVVAPLSLLAVGLVCAGILLLASGATSGARSSATSGNRKAIILAVCTGISIAGYSVLSGQGIRMSGSLLGYIAWLEISTGIGMVCFAATRSREALAEFAASHWRSGLAAGVLSVAGYAVALFAMSVAPIASVVALRETSVVFAACIGSLFLGERFGGRRIAASIVVVAGLVLLAVGSK